MTAYPEVKTLAEAKKINADYIEKKTRAEILINTIITTVKSMRKERLISLYDNQALTDNALELADVLSMAQKSVLTLTSTQRKVLEF